MHQRIATIVFLLALLVVCSSAYLVGRVLPPAAQVDARGSGTPPPPGPTARMLPGTQPAAPSRTPAGPVSRAAPTAARPSPGTSAPSETPERVASPTLTPEPTVTPTGTATPPAEAADEDYEFVLAAPVRHSSGDCPGNYILGQVRDRVGNPLPNVSLHLSDEYGNQQRQVTKSSAGELGRYDFPLFGPARRFYLSVVDAANQPLSPVIEISHGMGAFTQASCHWADWQRR